MSRRRDQRVRVNLNAGGLQPLPFAQIKAIMRGAEDMIMRGGRTLLCKILKGSRDKDVLERDLHQNPAWGFYRSLTNDEVLARIDWAILNDYLRIEYDRRLPLLCYAPAGLEIEIDTITDEHLARLHEMIAPDFDLPFLASLNDTPRATLERLLQKIEATRDRAFIPVLQSWRQVAYRKLRACMNRVIASLAPPGT